MRFDLADLRLFLATLDAGSITHGAAAANLSLPAASERLRAMEETGDLKLLVRGRRGVAATPAGETLAHHARLILGQVAHLRGELGDHAKGVRATVTLLANTAAINEFVPDRLGRWLAAHPQVDVDLKERRSEDIVNAVAAGLAEVGILSDAVDTGALVLRPFAVDRLVAVMAPCRPLARERRLSLSQVVNEPLIGVAGALQAHLEDHAARLGCRLSYRARMRSLEGACRMAAQGAGVAIVPETVARRSGGGGKLVAIRLSEPWATRRLSLCWSEEHALTPAATALIAALEAAG